MPDTILGSETLPDYLPHRGVNLIVDEVALSDDGKQSTSQTTVPAGDERGRELLSRATGDGSRVWYEPFLGEIMALGGVCLLKAGMSDDEVGVFSAISRFTTGKVPSQGETVTGHADIMRSRGEFTQFKAVMRQGGDEVLSAEVMSGTAKFADIAATPVVPLEGEAGDAPAADFSWKDASLRFISGVRSVDSEAGSLVATYVYPDDHPFIAGHFPASAIMMGVTQWAAVADAGWEAAARLGLGPKVLVNGAITKSDGTEVVNIRDLVLDAADGVPAIAATKRVAFRSPVVPGDGLLIAVTVSPC